MSRAKKKIAEEKPQLSLLEFVTQHKRYNLQLPEDNKELVQALYDMVGYRDTVKTSFIDADKFPVQFNDTKIAYRPKAERVPPFLTVRASFRNKRQSALSILPLAQLLLNEHSEMPNFGMGQGFSNMCRLYQHEVPKKHCVSEGEACAMEDRAIVLWHYMVKQIWGSAVYRSVQSEWTLANGSVDMWTSEAQTLSGRGILMSSGLVYVISKFAETR